VASSSPPSSSAASSVQASKASFFYDPKVRGIFYQVLLVLIIGFIIYEATTNAIESLRAAKIASGFGFMNNTAGFDVNQTLVSYSATSTYGRAFIVGLLNTLVVAAIGIVLATFLGFAVGVARLSSNWIIAKIAMIYVELIRNLPLVLQLLFWYNAVLAPLPAPKDSVSVASMFFLNNRGIVMPKPLFGESALLIPLAIVLGIIATLIFRKWAKKQQEQTGQQYPVWLVALLSIIGLPLLIWVALGAITGLPPITFDFPALI
jgi:general L-amino acid transport system permease protein